MEEEARVGHMAPSILEEFCLEYIKAHIKEGKFVLGVNFNYLTLYEELKKYNHQELKSTQSSQ